MNYKALVKIAVEENWQVKGLATRVRQEMDTDWKLAVIIAETVIREEKP